MKISKFTVYIHPDDVEYFKMAMLAEAWKHDESLRMEALETNITPKSQGSSRRLYTFRAPAPIIATLQEFARTLNDARHF